MLPVINDWVNAFNKAYAEREGYKEKVDNGEKVDDWRLSECRRELKKYSERLQVMFSLGFEATESTANLDKYLADEA